MNDAKIAVLIVAAFVGAFAMAGLWWWAAFWLALAILLGAMEFLAKRLTGRTLSQQFWAFKAQHPRAAWGLASLLAVGGLGLAVHLLWK